LCNAPRANYACNGMQLCAVHLMQTMHLAECTLCKLRIHGVQLCAPHCTICAVQPLCTLCSNVPSYTVQQCTPLTTHSNVGTLCTTQSKAASMHCAGLQPLNNAQQCSLCTTHCLCISVHHIAMRAHSSDASTESAHTILRICVRSGTVLFAVINRRLRTAHAVNQKFPAKYRQVPVAIQDHQLTASACLACHAGSMPSSDEGSLLYRRSIFGSLIRS